MQTLLLIALLAAPVNFIGHSGFEELDTPRKQQLKTGVAAAWPDSLPENILRLDCSRKKGVLGCSSADLRAGTSAEQTRPGDYPYTIAWRPLTAGELAWLESWLQLTWPGLDIETVETVEVERARGGIWVSMHWERTESQEVFDAVWLAGLVVRRLD